MYVFPIYAPFFAQFSEGASSPFPLCDGGGEERGEIFLPILCSSSDDAKEPLSVEIFYNYLERSNILFFIFIK